MSNIALQSNRDYHSNSVNMKRRNLTFSVTLLLHFGSMIIRPHIVQAQVCGTRCGLFRRTMYTGVAGSTSCQNRCVFTFTGQPRSSSYKCGTCSTFAVVTDNCDTTGPNSKFDICLKLLVDSQDIDVYKNARTRWSEVIKGDELDITDTSRAQALECGTYPNRIDDLYICGVSSNIDGVGKVLGYASALYVRSSDSLPVVGTMVFDSADVATLRSRGSLQSVILHEMGHVLGLESNTWSAKGVATRSGRQCSYTGINANNEYKKITGCSSVPLELDGGSGTACSHWDEECLGDELMTGFIGNATKATLSTITIGSLADIGYDVDYSKADTYTSLNVNRACRCNGVNRQLDEYTTMSDSNNNDFYRTSNHHRQLSEEGLKIATNYGLPILQKNMKFHSLISSSNIFSSSRSSSVNNNQAQQLTYVGHLGIKVYYLENDIIHDVWVTSP